MKKQGVNTIDMTKKCRTYKVYQETVRTDSMLSSDWNFS